MARRLTVNQVIRMDGRFESCSPHKIEIRPRMLHKAGDKIPMIIGDYVKVMAIADGYVMARRKGCYPFVCAVKEFDKILLSMNKSRSI